MSFVGTRPEVPKYVNQYQTEMLATLLTQAGITSVASIKYKDEDKVLANSSNLDDTYVKEILPEKMKINLEELCKYNFFKDIKTMFLTIIKVIK